MKLFFYSTLTYKGLFIYSGSLCVFSLDFLTGVFQISEVLILTKLFLNIFLNGPKIIVFIQEISAYPKFMKSFSYFLVEVMTLYSVALLNTVNCVKSFLFLGFFSYLIMSHGKRDTSTFYLHTVPIFACIALLV